MADKNNANAGKDADEVEGEQQAAEAPQEGPTIVDLFMVLIDSVRMQTEVARTQTAVLALNTLMSLERKEPPIPNEHAYGVVLQNMASMLIAPPAQEAPPEMPAAEDVPAEGVDEGEGEGEGEGEEPEG